MRRLGSARVGGWCFWRFRAKLPVGDRDRLRQLLGSSNVIHPQRLGNSGADAQVESVDVTQLSDSKFHDALSNERRLVALIGAAG